MKNYVDKFVVCESLYDHRNKKKGVNFDPEKKYINKIFIKDGGWHFSNLKNPVDIENKLKSYLHHRDFEVENIDLEELQVITNYCLSFA